MTTLLTVIHIAVCFFLVVIVLLQQGKGANMGATFGGSSQTVFGSEGPLPLLNKVTTLAAVTFMVTSIGLAYFSAHKSTSSVMKDFSVQKTQENAIERAPEALPQPDMPLIPAEPAQTETAQPQAGDLVSPQEVPAGEGSSHEVAPPPATEGKQEVATPGAGAPVSGATEKKENK
ncbi:MAG: preprotein translocase subunit SecG [Pseudomonadota bacterium]